MLLRIRIAMRQTKSFLQRLLSDSRSGDVSSKRVIGVVGFLSWMVMIFINLFNVVVHFKNQLQHFLVLLFLFMAQIINYMILIILNIQ